MQRYGYWQERLPDWRRLEELCNRAERRRWRLWKGPELVELAAGYRAACADLALAEQGDSPPAVVDYLHGLVARAHNLLYRTRPFRVGRWWHALFVIAPRQIFASRLVQLAALLFWIPFLVSFYLAGSSSPWPDYVDRVVGPEARAGLEKSFSPGAFGKSWDDSLAMAGFYIWHNIDIGLRCFAGGLLLIPGIFLLVSNAVFLGAVFGWMSRPEVAAGSAFYEFVIAHAPWELTAIVLSGAAGLRLGAGWIIPRGYSRATALQIAGREVLPVVAAAIVLFAGAAVVESLISPSPMTYPGKALVAVGCSMSLMVYLILLGGKTKGHRGT
ncbi:MAG: membrane protein [Pirellulaceae bacterium]|nr:MAG: membrane protein [Pirellulaceae bacterium]